MPLIFQMGSPKPRRFRRKRRSGGFWGRFVVGRPVSIEAADAHSHLNRKRWEDMPGTRAKGYTVYKSPMGRITFFEARGVLARVQILKVSGQFRGEFHIEPQRAALILEASQKFGVLTEAMNNLNKKLADLNLGYQWSGNLKKGFTFVHLGTIRGFFAALIKGEKTTYVGVASPAHRIKIPFISRIPVVGHIANGIANFVSYPVRRIRTPIRKDIESKIVNYKINLRKALDDFQQLESQITEDDMRKFKLTMSTGEGGAETQRPAMNLPEQQQGGQERQVA